MSESEHSENLDEASIEKAINEVVLRVFLERAIADQPISPEQIQQVTEATKRLRLGQVELKGRPRAGAVDFLGYLLGRPALSAEEKEATEILERVSRELAPLEERVQRLMHAYGL